MMKGKFRLTGYDWAFILGMGGILFLIGTIFYGVAIGEISLYIP